MNDARPRVTSLLAGRRRPAMFSTGLGGDVDLPHPANGFALKQAVSINPQQFAECGCIVPVCLAFLLLIGLDQNYILAAVVELWPSGRPPVIYSQSAPKN